MVDLHCHILPGLDDGARSLDESVAMAEEAINDGITRVVATPHASSYYLFDYAKVCQVSALLQKRVNGRLKLATGCDFHLSLENLAALRVDPAPFCINRKNYLLLEFNDHCIPLDGPDPQGSSTCGPMSDRHASGAQCGSPHAARTSGKMGSSRLLRANYGGLSCGSFRPEFPRTCLELDCSRFGTFHF